MKMLKSFISGKSPMAIFNALALMLVVQSVNSACIWMLYQPEVPESAKRFKKS